MSDELERIAVAFERGATILEKWYEKLYPPKREPKDVTLTRIPSDLDRIKAEQGASEETTEEWLSDIGPREREYLASTEARETVRPGRAGKKKRRRT